MFRRLAAGSALALGLVFTVESNGAQNVFDCKDASNTLDHYNKVLIAQKNNMTPNVSYDLGFTAICIGNPGKGVKHMRRASDGGHIAATKVLGRYYENDQSFDNNRHGSIENLYRAIVHFKKAAAQIESAASYPRGTVRHMERIEYVEMVSYRVFTALPRQYFNIFSELMGDTVDNGTIHPGTLKLVQEIGDAATRCLQRPPLTAWKEKKELVYREQQVVCQSYLDFARAIFPLEDERLQIVDNCKVSLNRCAQHNMKIAQMEKVLDKLFSDLKKAPSFVEKY